MILDVAVFEKQECRYAHNLVFSGGFLIFIHIKLADDRFTLILIGEFIDKRAYDFASKAHHGQMRQSGESYIEHPLQTALTLAGLQLDASSLAAALLHDVPENCGMPISAIETQFGSEVAKLVDGTTKLGKLSLPAPVEIVSRDSQAENLRKMLMAMAEDLRVVFIKLADRLHNMRTLGALPEERRHRIARETLEIFAPLANRLGIWQWKWELEDLGFRHLNPRRYREIAQLIADQSNRLLLAQIGQVNRFADILQGRHVGRRQLV